MKIIPRVRGLCFRLDFWKLGHGGKRPMLHKRIAAKVLAMAVPLTGLLYIRA
jgi:hypothetical protein